MSELFQEAGVTAEAAASMINFNVDLSQGSAKKAMKEIGAASRDLYYARREDIKVLDGFNVRVKNAEHAAHIRSLADSMKANGFYPHSPLAGYTNCENGQLVTYVTDGHCRLEARDLAVSEGADIPELPIVLAAQGTDVRDLTVALLTKNAGKPLTVFEQGVVVKRLSMFGMDASQIQARTGMSEQKIQNLLVLMGAPTAVRDMVEKGEVAASVAVREVKTKGTGATASLEEMKAKAKEKGHAKVTNRVSDQHQETRVARKAAPTLLELMREVMKDPAYEQISSELRQRIDTALGIPPKQDLLSGQPKEEGKEHPQEAEATKSTESEFAAA